MPVKFKVIDMGYARDGKSILIDGQIITANNKISERITYNSKTKGFIIDGDSILKTIDLNVSMKEFFNTTQDKTLKGFEVHF
jgi:hypothetical protein